MENHDISEKTIRSYLIGTLDESTVESLDELSITDQAFADRITAEQYELVDDWVAGRLGKAERDSFAAVLARSPAIREKVKVSQLMAAATSRVAVVESLTSAGFFAGWFGGLPRLAYGFAGLLLMLGIVGAILFLNRDRDIEIVQIDPPVNEPEAASSQAVTAPTVSVDPTTAPTPSPAPSNDLQPDESVRKSPTPEPVRPAARTFVALALSPPTRGSGEVRSVKIDAGVQDLELNVQTEASTDGGRFLIEITGPSGKIAWRSAPTIARRRTVGSVISVRAPAARLGSGIRTVRVLRKDGEVVDEHVVRIDR